MTTEEYYKTPKQEIFDDIKENAIKLWQKKDNTFGYVDEKVNKIKDIENISDNAWFIVAMFDIVNQLELMTMLKNPEGVQIIAGFIADQYDALNSLV